MDRFLKLSLKTLKDSDIHLIGIACLYIATKQCDIYHIPLTHFYDKVGHKKFPMDSIKEKETEILSVLKFNITFPTTLKLLNRILYKNFYANSSQTLYKVKENSFLILKMCLHDEKLCLFKPIVLAVGVVIYSLKSVFLEII